MKCDSTIEIYYDNDDVKAVDIEIEFYFEPEEIQTWDDPGCPACITVYKIVALEAFTMNEIGFPKGTDLIEIKAWYYVLYPTSYNNQTYREDFDQYMEDLC